MYFLPFQMKKTIRCPDGSTRIIYRKVNDAFPFEVFDTKASAKTDSKLPDITDLAVSGEYERTLNALLMKIDETNSSLMMLFRAAYVAFEANPCQNDKDFKKDVRDIRLANERNTLLKLKYAALLKILSQTPHNKVKIDSLLLEIAEEDPTIPIPQLTGEKMQQAAIEANEMKYVK